MNMGFLTPMCLAKAFRIHHILISAIARSAGATPEHVEVMSAVVAVLKALGAYGHARRERTCSASIRYVAHVPHEATCRAVIIGFHLSV